jgi:uncharacterized protein YlxW (UPF0749 family)
MRLSQWMWGCALGCALVGRIAAQDAEDVSVQSKTRAEDTTVEQVQDKVEQIADEAKQKVEAAAGEAQKKVDEIAKEVDRSPQAKEITAGRPV